jgi:protein-S-isoprenylcysteine O-methyltransferase Ste14
MFEIQRWMILAAIALVFLIASKLIMLRALFRTKALSWAKHKKSAVSSEAAAVWWLAFLLVLGMGIGEYFKRGNPLLDAGFTNLTHAGIALLVLGLWTWLAAMDARKQYYWYFQVLGPKEELPPYSTNGIYASIRNPRDLGLVLVLAGLSALLGLVFTLGFTVLFLFATMYRVSTRDRALIEKHGKPYIDYLRSTKKLIPYVY